MRHFQPTLRVDGGYPVSNKTYEVKALCPHCGQEEVLHIEAAGHAALPEGEAPKALAECSGCGKRYDAPVDQNTCSDWDDFCKEIHPVPQV